MGFDMTESIQTALLLKGTYYGFLKIALHVVCNIDLSERKHPAKF